MIIMYIVLDPDILMINKLQTITRTLGAILHKLHDKLSKQELLMIRKYPQQVVLSVCLSQTQTFHKEFLLALKYLSYWLQKASKYSLTHIKHIDNDRISRQDQLGVQL